MGAAAQFNGVHILGEIRPARGMIPWPNRDGRTELDRLSQPKKSAIPQSAVGGLFMFGDWPWDGTPALFVGTEIGGNIRRLGVVEGMTNW